MRIRALTHQAGLLARITRQPYLLQYWELWNRYTQFTRGGKLPDSYDFWRRQAPMLHAMSLDQIVANDMVILGSAETVANAILRLTSQLDLGSGPIKWIPRRRVS